MIKEKQKKSIINYLLYLDNKNWKKLSRTLRTFFKISEPTICQSQLMNRAIITIQYSTLLSIIIKYSSIQLHL